LSGGDKHTAFGEAKCRAGTRAILPGKIAGRLVVSGNCLWQFPLPYCEPLRGAWPVRSALPFGNALAYIQTKCRGSGYNYILLYRKPLARKRFFGDKSATF
jgi:hypothetical protein